MGSECQKQSRKNIVANTQVTSDNGSSNCDVPVECINKFDKQIINSIKKDLRETPEIFVLNNVLMSVMFFQNYQKDIKEVVSKLYEKDGESIAPDTIIERANANVCYRPLHGPKKLTSEPLVSKRLYVINDYIKVVDSWETENHKTDKPKVRIEESIRKGFVKLRETDPSPVPPDTEVPIEVTDITPRSSSAGSSDSNYGYATITELKTPKPIDILKGLGKNDPLPESCTAHRRVKKPSCDLNLDERDANDINEDELYDTVTYISSRGYMKHFESNLFSNIWESNQMEMSLPKSIPGKIFCNLPEDNHNAFFCDTISSCEVIPALSIPWQRSQTLEFIMKSEIQTKGKLSFPHRKMISEIEHLNCVVVPKGYFKKRGVHPDSDIEWEIEFPQAERYLTTFMSHAQTKCFLFLAALHKTYIEPKTHQVGLLREHIRSFLLWECESNYKDWPEHRLGTKIVCLLKRFNKHLRQSKPHLPDYFIRDKNIFENVPTKYLRHAQKVFHEVLESPVMSFIKCLRNIRYTQGKSFYPPFDFDQLYDILDKNRKKSMNHGSSENLNFSDHRVKVYYDSDLQLKHLLELKRREKVLEKRQKQENGNLSSTDERRISLDSVDLNWICEKQFDMNKKEALLTLFINHYIDIGKKSFQIATYKQTLFYLKQARYLAIILEDECPVSAEKLEHFSMRIKILEEECARKWSTGESPLIN